jgi:uncharacterized membrane protein
MVVLNEHTCLNEDQVEKYLLQHLDEPEIAVVEEKLLVCERCQEIYSGVETYVYVMHRVTSITAYRPRQLSVRHTAGS